MTDYKRVMSLLVHSYPYRHIQTIAGCSPRTIAKVRKVLDSNQITGQAQVDALSAEEIDALFTDGRKSVDGEFVPIDVDAIVKARVGRKKPPLKVLWARYLQSPKPTPVSRFYGYERFCQIVAEHVKIHDLTAAIVHVPGHTMQVDWAGTRMRITDPITHAVTNVSVFVATLPYSGMIFAYGCTDEKIGAWCDAHRRAFEYFCGVAQVIIPDNASTASNQISRYDKARDVNQSYASFLEYYRTAAVPARSLAPKDKPSAEAGVKVVTNWIIHYLDDRRFADLDEVNDAIGAQVDMINNRTPFRGEQQSRRAWFTDAEASELLDLPDQPWQQVIWRKAKVSRDWHIQVDTIKYSVPHTFAGQMVDVRVAGTIVTVLAAGEIIAEHRLTGSRHAYVTDPAHAPRGYEDTHLLWTRAYFLRQAAKIGPATVEALTRLLDRKKIEAQGYRPCMNILGLGKGDISNKLVLEQACSALCSEDSAKPISYTAVKHRITALRATDRPHQFPGRGQAPTPPVGRAPAPVRDTSRAHLGGIDDFSLDKLTGPANDETGV